MDQVGAEIVDILEWAGTLYLKPGDPGLYRAYLLHVGTDRALRHYDGSETYWDHVQMILDGFFTSSERSEICAQVIGHQELRGRPEFRGFLMRALAERRLQNMLRATAVIASTKLDARSAAARAARSSASRRSCTWSSRLCLYSITNAPTFARITSGTYGLVMKSTAPSE